MTTRTQRRTGSALSGLPSLSGAERATPFLKWAGGKSQLLASFDNFIPEKFNRFYEPFTGGGAVFFYLKSHRPPFAARLSDLNHELINCYTVVRDQCDELIADLQKHHNEPDYFYQLRAANPKRLSAVKQASRLIFLNKTCFNGLYRVNSKGQFNVPFGSYRNPKFCNAENLRACSTALRDTVLECASFEEILEHAGKGDFIYFDPPYHPLSSTSNFTNYTRGSFSGADQQRLGEVFEKLSRKGCLLMLSNSDCQFIRDIYDGFKIHTVSALRAINCKAAGRGRISELVVTNYKSR